MGGLAFFFNWVLDWVFPLMLGGIALWMLLGFFAALLFAPRKPGAAQASLAYRLLVVAFVVSFCVYGIHFSLAKNLGRVVGGTTNSGYAGLGEDGEYYLLERGHPDKLVPVSADKYWALYWCEFVPFPEVIVAVALGWLVMLTWNTRWGVGGQGPKLEIENMVTTIKGPANDRTDAS